MDDMGSRNESPDFVQNPVIVDIPHNPLMGNADLIQPGARPSIPGRLEVFDLAVLPGAGPAVAANSLPRRQSLASPRSENKKMAHSQWAARTACAVSRTFSSERMVSKVMIWASWKGAPSTSLVYFSTGVSASDKNLRGVPQKQQANFCQVTLQLPPNRQGAWRLPQRAGVDEARRFAVLTSGGIPPAQDRMSPGWSAVSAKQASAPRRNIAGVPSERRGRRDTGEAAPACCRISPSNSSTVCWMPG